MEKVKNETMGEIKNQLDRAMVEIFGKDLPEGTSIYSRDK